MARHYISFPAADVNRRGKYLLYIKIKSEAKNILQDNYESLYYGHTMQQQLNVHKRRLQYCHTKV